MKPNRLALSAVFALLGSLALAQKTPDASDVDVKPAPRAPAPEAPRDTSDMDVLPAPPRAPADASVAFKVSPSSALGGTDKMLLAAGSQVTVSVYADAPALIGAAFYILIPGPNDQLEFLHEGLVFFGMLLDGELLRRIDVPKELAGTTLAGVALATDGYQLVVSKVRHAFIQ